MNIEHFFYRGKVNLISKFQLNKFYLIDFSLPSFFFEF